MEVARDFLLHDSLTINLDQEIKDIPSTAQEMLCSFIIDAILFKCMAVLN